MTSTVRIVLAVLAGGVAGTIANSIVVSLLLGVGFVGLATSPGRLIVAILVAALVPIIAMRLKGGAEAAASIVALTVIPSLLAKLVFGAGAAWPFVLFVNAVYAVAAWAVYHAIAGWGRTRPISAHR